MDCSKMVVFYALSFYLTLSEVQYTSFHW